VLGLDGLAWENELILPKAHGLESFRLATSVFLGAHIQAFLAKKHGPGPAQGVPYVSEQKNFVSVSVHLSWILGHHCHLPSLLCWKSASDIQGSHEHLCQAVSE